MSSILKALKRVEHEKMVRSPEALNIDADILRVTDSPRNISVRSIALLLVLFFGGGAAVAVYILKEAPKPLQKTRQQPAVQEQQSRPTPPPPVVSYEKTPAEIVIIPARTSPPKTTTVKQNGKTVTTGTVPKAGSVKKAGSAAELQPRNKSTAGAAPELPSVPVLRVNGIAFQNNSADSMAIVNGIPVSTGSVIEGVTVDELQKDRIIFQRDGEKFEIRLGQSNN